MKATLFLCALAGHALASQPVLVRVNARTLAELQARDPMIRLENPPEAQSKVVRPGNQSLISKSTILHDGSHWTLIPKDAVVFLPDALKSKVNVSPSGILLPWDDFLTRNWSWIATSEVTFDQAAGNVKIAPETVASWKKQDKLVIAVHQSGPISVRVAGAPPTDAKR